MSDQIMEIAGRIRELRGISELSIEELAPKVHVSPEQLEQYEGGTTDIPISFLLALCNLFHMELSELLTGGLPKLSQYTLTRSGKGRTVNRRKEYHYQSLGFNMAHKIAEPFLVTTEPVPYGTPCASYEHEGQEFDYVLEGTIRLMIDGKELILEEGDSVYFDSGYPHGAQAIGDKPAKFLALVIGTESEILKHHSAPEA